MRIIIEMEQLLCQWSEMSILPRLLLSVLCGGLIGLFRTLKHKGAGFKTHLLLCMGSALATMTGIYVVEMYGYSADVGRIPAGIVSGISFLGVGTILVTGHRHITGLTTAAGLWTTACIGMALGSGFVLPGLVSTIVLLFVHTVFNNFDSMINSRSKVMYLYVEFRDKDAVGRFIEEIENRGLKVVKVALERSGSSTLGANVEMKNSERFDHDALVMDVLQMDGIVLTEEI